MANSLDPDETLRYAASHLDPNCLQRSKSHPTKVSREKNCKECFQDYMSSPETEQSEAEGSADVTPSTSGSEHQDVPEIRGLSLSQTCLREKCWLCDAMFTSWAALKKHLVGPAHTRMTVICPWCTGVEKTFTRVADMKTHAFNIHQLEGVQDRHFSRGVGFYFARHPADYVRLVDYVAGYGDQDATEARSLMRKWAEKQEDSKAWLDRLNKGWKVEDTGRSRSQEKVGRRKKEEKSKSRSVERSGDKRTVEEESKSRERSRTEKSKSKSVERSGDKRTVEEESESRERSRTEKSKSRSVERSEDRRTVVERSSPVGQSMDRIDGKGDNVNRVKVTQKDSGSVNGGVEVKKRQLGIVKEDESSLKKKQRVEEKDSDEEEFRAYKDDIVLEESETDSSDSESEVDSQISSASGSILQDQLRVRATRILMRGAMPICPPAQRDWSLIAEVKIEGGNGSMVWPPKNWRNMSPDQKLMAHEYAALFLEQSKSKDFPVELSRRALLDKYNFMALEGAARPKPESSRHKIDSKLRYYNFQFARDVAKGSIKDSRMSQGVIGSMERAERWRDTDKLTELLDNANVKLRV